MIQLIEVGVIGFLSSKALKVFGSKDVAEIILFVTVLYISVHIIIGFGDWATGVINWFKTYFGWLF